MSGVPSLVDAVQERDTCPSPDTPTSAVGAAGTSARSTVNFVVPSAWFASSGLPARSVMTLRGVAPVVCTTEITYVPMENTEGDSKTTRFDDSR